MQRQSDDGDPMMYPKTKPRDPAVIRKLRQEQPYCERCGNPRALEVAHIISKGAGGPDVRENLVVLCGPASYQQGCHGLNHTGRVSQEELFRIAAKREGVDPEECRKRVRRRMGYDV